MRLTRGGQAAAILSHISPSATGTSLPEDRSLWPSFLAGGQPRAVASSVPAGPRMHDFALPAKNAGTQIRPGVVAVPVSPSSSRSGSFEDMELEDGGFRHARGWTVKEEEEEGEEAYAHARVGGKDEDEWVGMDMDMD